MPFVELQTNLPAAKLPRDLPAALCSAAATILGKPPEVSGGAGVGAGAAPSAAS